MDTRLFFLINRAQHRLFQFADNESVKRLGIPVTQVAAMLFVKKNEGCLQKDLSQALGLNNSAITGLLNRMERNELIERRPCELDGRASRLFLSDFGKKKMPKVRPLISELNDMIVADFDEEEVEIITRFLNKLIKDF